LNCISSLCKRSVVVDASLEPSDFLRLICLLSGTWGNFYILLTLPYKAIALLTKMSNFVSVRAGNEFVKLRFEPLCVFGFGVDFVVGFGDCLVECSAEYAERSDFSA
jgi:hypothetical protein